MLRNKRKEILMANSNWTYCHNNNEYILRDVETGSIIYSIAANCVHNASGEQIHSFAKPCPLKKRTEKLQHEIRELKVELTKWKKVAEDMATVVPAPCVKGYDDGSKDV